jgi:hypothetical protein
MASSWSNKLETRLSALADGASRESIQTLAKWIGFNRKHIKAFCTTLDSHLASSSSSSRSSAARQWLYIQIVHEVLLLEKDNPIKWERLGETRIAMGESVMLPALQRSDKARKEKVAPLIDEWAKHNVFGTPTLVGQMSKIVSSESTQEQGEEVTTKVEEVTTKVEEVTTKVEEVTTKEEELTTKVEEVATKEDPKKEVKQETTQEVAKPKVKDDVLPKKKIADATKKEQKLEKAKAERTPSLSSKPSASTEEVTFDFEGSVRFTFVLFRVLVYAIYFFNSPIAL